MTKTCTGQFPLGGSSKEEGHIDKIISWTRSDGKKGDQGTGVEVLEIRTGMRLEWIWR